MVTVMVRCLSFFFGAEQAAKVPNRSSPHPVKCFILTFVSILFYGCKDIRHTANPREINL
ncbi:hypothetical protein EZS27_019394 [termite gut metagenome]|uniref:Uncharacterized protein n=1 Tax=termite gut metagenome TaxID=433724 RepID=A0A5J4REX5_9ZZZZ